jgi:oligopeptide transport system substrate-binding protein
MVGARGLVEVTAMQRRLPGVLLCIAVVVAACESATVSVAPPATNEPGMSAEASTVAASGLAAEQILRVVLPGEPATLDPTLAAGPEVAVIRGLHRPLVDLDEHSQVIPALAESWAVSPDARTLTFSLRDAKYSNGDPILAADLVYSWRRLADPRIAAPYSYAIADVVGGPELLAMLEADLPTDAEIEAALNNLGVEAPDDRTFIVHLNGPATYFLTAMTLWVFGPLQESWITQANATDPANYVSSGPFILDTWSHDREIILKPNTYWYGQVRPTVTEIRMSIFGEPGQAQAAYEANEIDLVITPNEDVQRVRNDPVLGAAYREFPVLAINYYAFNNFQDPTLASFADPGPTANKAFRTALIQAIDKAAMIDATYGGLGRVANSFIMPGIPGHQPDLDPYPYDLDAARAQMDDAVTEMGVSSAKQLGTVKIGYGSGLGREPQVAFLAEAWRQAFGLETDQIVGDPSVFVAERGLGAYDISAAGWSADFPHAHNQLSGVFTCRGANNVAQYCNPVFDRHLARAAAEADPDEQLAILEEAETLLMEDAAFLPIVFLVTPYEAKPWVSGLTVTPLDGTSPGSWFYETIRIISR